MAFEVYDLARGKRRCAAVSLKAAFEYAGAIGNEHSHPAHLVLAGRILAPCIEEATAAPPVLRLTGCSDGLALSFGGDEVFVFPDFDGAQAAFHAAKDGQRMLAACLAVGREAA
jgi:hypothetical protein